MKKLSHFVKKVLSKYFFNFFFNFLQQILRFIVLYLVAHKFGPIVFGTISIVILYNSYLLNANLGAVNGLKRQIPIKYSLIGGLEIKNASYSVLVFNIFSTFFFALIVSAVLFIFKILTAVNCLHLIILSSCNSFYFFSQTYVIANQLWRKLQILQFASSLFLIITTLSIWFLGKDFFFLFYSLSFFVPAIIILSKQITKATFDFSFIKENIKIGFPIMVAGLVFFLFQTTDRLVISKYYTKEIFGIYALATTLVSGFGLFTNLASEIILQKGINYILLTNSNVLLRRYLTKITVGVSISLLPILIVAYLGFKLIIENYFPLYITSLPIILNLLCAFFLQQLCIGFGNYYYIIESQLLYNVLLGLSVIISFGLISYPYIFNIQDTTILVSQRFAISSAIYSALIIVPVFVFSKKSFKKIKF